MRGPLSGRNSLILLLERMSIKRILWTWAIMLQVRFHQWLVLLYLISRSEDLSSKRRCKEAAQVLLDYCQDIRDAVIALTAGNLFSEARRIVSPLLRCMYGLWYLCQQVNLKSVPELIEDVIYPAAFESRAQISEDVGEMREQLRKQVNRLRELRIKKTEEPGMSHRVISILVCMNAKDCHEQMPFTEWKTTRHFIM